MNWRIGLFRLWIVASLAWAALVGWMAYDRWTVAAQQGACYTAREANPSLGSPLGCFTSAATMFDDLVPWDSYLRYYLLLALLPVIGFLIVGLALRWIGAGFQRSRSN